MPTRDKQRRAGKGSTVQNSIVQHSAVQNSILASRVTLNILDTCVKICSYPEFPRHGAFPISLYRCIIHLLAGLRNPRKAKVIVDKVIAKTCIPVPHNIERSMGLNEGGRKTSPCTSFHPLSSWASSSVCIYHHVSQQQERTVRHTRGNEEVLRSRG